MSDTDRGNIELEAGQPQPGDAARHPAYMRIQRVLERLRESWQLWLIGLVLVAAAASLFFALAGEVLEEEDFAWDAPVMEAVHGYSAPWLDALMIVASWVGGDGHVFVMAAGAAVLWRERRQVAAVTLVVSVAGAFLLNTWLKLLFSRARPEVFEPLLPETTFSFPSGHAMNAVALYGFVAYLLWRVGQRAWAIGAVLLGLLISFSRIYLGVHYPSDILGALAVGVPWLGVVIVGYHYIANLPRR